MLLKKLSKTNILFRIPVGVLFDLAFHRLQELQRQLHRGAIYLLAFKDNTAGLPIGMPKPSPQVSIYVRSRIVRVIAQKRRDKLLNDILQRPFEPCRFIEIQYPYMNGALRRIRLGYLIGFFIRIRSPW